MRLVVSIMLVGLALNFALGAWFFSSVKAAGGVVVVLAACFALLWWWGRNSRLQSDELVGWKIGEAVELSDPLNPQRVDGVIPATYMGLGALCLGAPKAGKTESYMLGILDQLSEFWPGSGYAVFEGKGDIDIYKKTVASSGAPDFFFSSELPGSHSVNLMDGEAPDVVDRLRHSLIGKTASTDFYSDEQTAKLLLVVPVLKGLPEVVCLRDLYTVLAIEDAESALLRHARNCKVDPVALKLYQDWVRSDEHFERVKVLQGLLNKLFRFVCGPNTDRLNAYDPDIRISDIVDRGLSVYFHLPLSQFSRDVAVVLVEMFHVEARKRQLAGADGFPPFPLFLDDWGDFFHENFTAFSARCRSASMPLFFSFQSLAQLDAVSTAFRDTLDDTIATKIVMRVMGENTSKYASELLGEYERMELGSSELGGRDGVSLMNRALSRFRPQDFKALQPGECFLSTLLDVRSETINPILRTRLPLPDFRDWQAVSMPTSGGLCSQSEATKGLGFWDRFVDPESQRRLQQAAQSGAEQHLEVV